MVSIDRLLIPLHFCRLKKKKQFQKVTGPLNNIKRFLEASTGIRCLFDPWNLDLEQVFFGSHNSDPGSQTHIFQNLVTIFWVKFYNSLKIGTNFFLQYFKNKIIFNLVKFVATKKGITKIFFHPSLLLLFLDPGSETRDPGYVKIRFPDPGLTSRIRNTVRG